MKDKNYLLLLGGIVLLAAAALFGFTARTKNELWKKMVTEGEKPEEERDTTPILGGAQLTMLQSQSVGQMLSILLETKDGSLIILDGGRWEDCDYLCSKIREKGGHVSAWFLTHTNTDHVGALLNLLQRMEAGEDTGITIDQICYNFAEPEWYLVHDPDDVGTAYAIISLLNRLPESQRHIVEQGEVIQIDDVKIRILNSRYEPDADHIGENDGNDSGMVYQAEVGDVKILFLGDMGETAGDLLLEELGAEALRSDIVQMAHHGQDGVTEKFYQAVAPKICLWPTPQWLWDNESGQFQTLETRNWMQKLKAEKHYCTKDGDQVIR